MFKGKILIFLVLLVVVAIAWRFAGERAMKVEPETVPDIAVDANTSISRGVSGLLEQQGESEESFFFPLYDPYLALISRIQLADLAEQTLDAQYYLFHDDTAGRALLASFIKAANRGVKVRLLLDEMDVKGREALFARLAADNENLEIRVFNPIWLRSLGALSSLEFLVRFPRVTRRMHNKSFTVDNISSIVGGRNIGNEYFAVESEVAFSDFDLLIGGAISVDVVNEFNLYWHSGIAVDISRLADPSDNSVYQTWGKEIEKDLDHYYQLVDKYKAHVINNLKAGHLKPYFDRGEVIFDQPEKVLTPLSDNNGHLAPKILALMGSAQQKLTVVSPYFIPGDVGMSLFKSLRDQGVDITILTNSLSANDVAAVHSGYSNYRRDLLEMGVKLYEMKPQNDDQTISLLGSRNVSLHAKSFVVDEDKIFVGSFNLDPRSALHNTEMGVVFNNSEYASGMVGGIGDYLSANAYRVALKPDGTMQWHDDVSGVVYDTEPETSWLQRTVVGLISWLPVEWLL